MGCQKTDKASLTMNVNNSLDRSNLTTREISDPILSETPIASSWKCWTGVAAAATVAGTFLCISSPLLIVGAAGWLLCTFGIMLANHLARGSQTLWAKNIRQIHAAVVDINCSFASFFLFPAAFFSSYHGAQGNLKGRPILMLNGYLGAGSTWHYLRGQLSEAGFGPVYTMNIGSFESIGEYAVDVERKINQIKEETGRNDIALICHSKGGLVGSYYATKRAASNDVHVTDIVMIGAPLSGAPIARYGFGQDAQEMHPDHPFHRDLQKEIQQHPEIRFFQIASEADMVVPLTSALLGGEPSRQRVFQDLGHLSMLFSPRTADQICHWLRA